MPLYLANRKIFQQFQQKGSVSFHCLLMSSVMLRKPLWCKQKNKAGAPGPGRRVILLLSLGHVPNQNAWAEIGGVYPRDKQGAASRSRSEHWGVRSKQRMRRWTLFLYLRMECPEASGDSPGEETLLQVKAEPAPFLTSVFSQFPGCCFLVVLHPFWPILSLFPRLLLPPLSSLEGRYHQVLSLGFFISKQLSACSVYTASSSGPQPSLGPTPIAYE